MNCNNKANFVIIVIRKNVLPNQREANFANLQHELRVAILSAPIISLAITENRKLQILN